MPKEWILNSAMNRYKLNSKKNVGAVVEAIRKCSPKSCSEWEDYYFSNVRSKNEIIELGKKLFIKITEVIAAEVKDISEEDCVEYMFQMISKRTYDGYTTEISTVHELLENILNIKINPASDEWDRKYNVDFYIQIKDKYIGIQIKPVADTSQISEIYKQNKIQKDTHRKFTSIYGGKVFYVFSRKEGRKKVIENQDVIEEIKNEILKLEIE